MSSMGVNIKCQVALRCEKVKVKGEGEQRWAFLLLVCASAPSMAERLKKSVSGYEEKTYKRGKIHCSPSPHTFTSPYNLRSHPSSILLVKDKRMTPCHSRGQFFNAANL